ncbi:MAG: 30S ribosomal protein S7 [Rickettsiales endosymbiont of Dermacentor nuttalli]
MSRRRAAVRRVILPDAKFGNLILARFINCIMRCGKKSAAERIVYRALEIVEKKSKQNALEFFLEAIKTVSPTIEVRSRRVGGATYQVPVEVRDTRAIALAIRWVIAAAAKRPEKTMEEKLAGELFDAYNQRGSAIKKREDTHKMAEANKAFSHYRW